MNIERTDFRNKILQNILDVPIDINTLKYTGFKLSSVLIIIHFTDSIPRIILTKRHSSLQHHANEISFPGGTFQDKDLSLLYTALRETEEEIGLIFHPDEIIGCFQTVRTLTSNFIILPFITIQDRIDKPTILIKEVTEVLDIPVFDLFECLDNNFKYKNFQNSYLFRYDNKIIWGATARIIKQLRDCFYE